MSDLNGGGVGPDEFVRQLVECGYTVEMHGPFATFAYTIPIGSRIGERVQLGLLVPGDFPLTAPPGPHISPVIPHPHGGVHGSDLGAAWCYWSRPCPGWERTARTVKVYLRHLQTLFGQL